MTVQTARFARAERLADELKAVIGEANDHDGIVDLWALCVATSRIERDLDTLRTILRAGAR